VGVEDRNDFDKGRRTVSISETDIIISDTVEGKIGDRGSRLIAGCRCGIRNSYQGEFPQVRTPRFRKAFENRQKPSNSIVQICKLFGNCIKALHPIRLQYGGYTFGLRT
jgi:hypothetical protein